MLGQPNNDKDFRHTQVGKIALVMFDIEAFKISFLHNHLLCWDCLTMLKKKHTHMLTKAKISELYSPYNFSTL